MIQRFLTCTLIFIAICNHGLAQRRYLPISEGEVVHHNYYSLSYIEQAEQAEWVYYELTEQMVSGTAQRSDDFREDKKVSTTSAQLIDYKGSGYDRGHLCPAGSMSQNVTAMSESFFLSNMSPQVPSFNRGGWKQLEAAVRSWVGTDSLLYVVTGPVLTRDLPTIGVNNVAVPSYFYKVIYSPTKSKMTAFLMPNAKTTKPLADYATTVDLIEEVTNIDFFAQLPDAQERELEGSTDISLWELSNTTFQSNPTQNKIKSSSATCLGISKSGERCKNHTKNQNGYCHLHQDQAPKI